MQVQEKKEGIELLTMMLSEAADQRSGQLCKETLTHPMDQKSKCQNCGLQFFAMSMPKMRV
jgi:hypothetical protein